MSTAVFALISLGLATALTGGVPPTPSHPSVNDRQFVATRRQPAARWSAKPAASAAHHNVGRVRRAADSFGNKRSKLTKVVLGAIPVSVLSPFSVTDPLTGLEQNSAFAPVLIAVPGHYPVADCNVADARLPVFGHDTRFRGRKRRDLVRLNSNDRAISAVPAASYPAPAVRATSPPVTLNIAPRQQRQNKEDSHRLQQRARLTAVQPQASFELPDSAKSEEAPIDDRINSEPDAYASQGVEPDQRANIVPARAALRLAAGNRLNFIRNYVIAFNGNYDGHRSDEVVNNPLRRTPKPPFTQAPSQTAANLDVARRAFEQQRVNNKGDWNPANFPSVVDARDYSSETVTPGVADSAVSSSDADGVMAGKSKGKQRAPHPRLSVLPRLLRDRQDDGLSAQRKLHVDGVTDDATLDSSYSALPSAPTRHRDSVARSKAHDLPKFGRGDASLNDADRNCFDKIKNNNDSNYRKDRDSDGDDDVGATHKDGSAVVVIGTENDQADSGAHRRRALLVTRTTHRSVVETCERLARIVVNGRNQIAETIAKAAASALDERVLNATAHSDGSDGGDRGSAGEATVAGDASAAHASDVEAERRRISEAIARVLNDSGGNKLDRYFRCVERLTHVAARPSQTAPERVDPPLLDNDALTES